MSHGSARTVYGWHFSRRSLGLIRVAELLYDRSMRMMDIRMAGPQKALLVTTFGCACISLARVLVATSYRDRIWAAVALGFWIVGVLVLLLRATHFGGGPAQPDRDPTRREGR